MSKRYELPALPYEYHALEPYLSEQILKLHHDKHHAAYVNGANAALDKLEKARKGEIQIDVRSVLRDFSFNYSGHFLHSLFWMNMSPARGAMMNGKVSEKIAEDFGDFDKFKLQFTEAAKTVEGSGWAVLQYDRATNQLLIAQIEKHSRDHLVNLPVVMCVDVWEHAYYIQYQNDRAKFIDAWWNVVNWDDVSRRLEAAME
jgi:superoxide dismutase, Fe-Mn family